MSTLRRMHALAACEGPDGLTETLGATPALTRREARRVALAAPGERRQRN